MYGVLTNKMYRLIMKLTHSYFYNRYFKDGDKI